jgi:hypothetical protein
MKFTTANKTKWIAIEMSGVTDIKGLADGTVEGLWGCLCLEELEHNKVNEYGETNLLCLDGMKRTKTSTNFELSAMGPIDIDSNTYEYLHENFGVGCSELDEVAIIVVDTIFSGNEYAPTKTPRVTLGVYGGVEYVDTRTAGEQASMEFTAISGDFLCIDDMTVIPDCIPIAVVVAPVIP